MSMIKPPYSYLFYSILAVLLFSWGCYHIFVQQTRQDLFGFLILSLPLVLSVVFFGIILDEKEKVAKHKPPP